MDMDQNMDKDTDMEMDTGTKTQKYTVCNCYQLSLNPLVTNRYYSTRQFWDNFK